MGKIKNWLIIVPAVFVLVAISSSLPSSAEGASYKYIDKKGTVHFTDRYESIPQEYRDQIKVIREIVRPEAPAPPSEGKEKKEGGGPSSVEQAGKSKEAEVQKEAEAKKAQEKEAEEKKLKAFQDKEERIESLQKKIEDKQKEKKNLRTRWMVYDRNTVYRLDREIEALEKQIQAIQNEPLP